MRQCKDIAEEASNYINGDLPFAERMGLFFHLVLCKCCRNYLQQMRQTISTLSLAKPREQDATDTNALAKQLHDLCHKHD